MRSSRRADPCPAWVTRWGPPSLIVLAAFGLRILRLGDANLWWDEALAIWGVRKGLLGVTRWTAGDVHPPLYFWSLWAWVQLAGESEFAMRSLSVLFGVLTVAVVHGLGSLMAGRRVGNLAALLTALSRFHIWWSQEMRMYVLAGLAGMLSLYLFLRWLRSWGSGPPENGLADRRRPGGTGRGEDSSPHSPAAVVPPGSMESASRGNYLERMSPGLLLALYALASICALYTIYLMASLVLVENVVVLVVLVRRRGLRRRALLLRWIAAQLAILAALAAWLMVSWGKMATWSVSEPFDPLLFVRLYATLLATGVSVDVHRYAAAALLPLAVLLLGGILSLSQWVRSGRSRGWQPLGALSLGLSLLLPGAAIYLASLPRGLFYAPRIEARYFLPFAPAFWILLAWSVTAIGRRWRGAGWVCGGALLAMWLVLLPGYYRGRHLRDELQTMTRAILSQAEPGDVVLLDSGGRYPLFLYYYERVLDAPQRPPMLKIPPDGGELIPGEVDDILRPVAERYQRVWLAEVEVNLSDLEHLAQGWLAERYPEVLALAYGHNTLRLYDPKGRAPTLAAAGYEPQHRLDEPVGAGGHLRGWEMPVETFIPGDVAHISLLWERLPEEPVSLALCNRSGQVLLRRRAEAGPGLGARRQQFDFPVFAHTPAGAFYILLSPAPMNGPVLGTLRIAGTVPLPDVPPPEVVVGARFDQDVTLVGYTMRGAASGDAVRVGPGDALVIDLYWRAERKLDQDYTVFAHLLGQAYNPKTQGPVWAQHDGQPADGGYPTTQWLEGDLIVDRHTMTVDEGAQPGVYRLEVGMYTLDDGRRLAVTSRDGQALGDRLLLDSSVKVGEP